MGKLKSNEKVYLNTIMEPDGYGEHLSNYFNYFTDSSPHGKVIRYLYGKHGYVAKSIIAKNVAIHKLKIDRVLNELLDDSIVENNGDKYCLDAANFRRTQDTIRILFGLRRKSSKK